MDIELAVGHDSTVWPFRHVISETVGHRLLCFCNWQGSRSHENALHGILIQVLAQVYIQDVFGGGACTIQHRKIRRLYTHNVDNTPRDRGHLPTGPHT